MKPIKPKFARVFKEFGISPSRKPKKHPFLAGIMPVFGPGYEGHCNFTFGDELVKRLGKVLQKGIFYENATYLVAFCGKKTDLWEIYIRTFKGTESYLLWRMQDFPLEFGPVYYDKK